MAGPIIACVDGSPPSVAAVEWAASDACRRSLELRLVHVCEQWARDSGSVQYCSGMLDAAADRARGLAPGIEVVTEMLPGQVVGDLIRESAQADSLVLGSRGLGGFAGMVLGSTSLALAGHAPVPVVVVREASTVRHGRIVVGYDGHHSQAAMEYAVTQARAQDAELLVLHAWQPPMLSSYAAAYSVLTEDFKEKANAVLQEVMPWKERNPDVRIVDDERCDHPVSALRNASSTADLVVVGSRGLGGFASAVLGSVSHGVLHHAACPVAVVPPQKAAHRSR
ncbi:universal stress protein UspA [Nonomuraea sp. WAC 01424]|uniref:universal stress protein n=1 Tax=Nonomuraea sp. WAC 01424 TaxID=2203200 RepID=UPI000F7B114A|nr:universal stress protein [Nonomuraea sp. WAC 01424]RSN09267.1 universal stress protein UspA [Nonomuraea sp. WAC 01424]